MNSSDSLFMVCYISFGSNCMLKTSVHTSLDYKMAKGQSWGFTSRSTDYKMETGYLQHNFGKRGCDYWKCTSELLTD